MVKRSKVLIPTALLVLGAVIAILFADPIKATQTVGIELHETKVGHRADKQFDVYFFKLETGKIVKTEDELFADKVKSGENMCINIYETMWFGQQGVDWRSLKPCE